MPGYNPHRVRTPHRLPNDSRELTELYETSSIYVLPSESENFPTVLLEAMAAPNAVITSYGTRCQEVVDDTVCSWSRGIPLTSATRCCLSSKIPDAAAR